MIAFFTIFCSAVIVSGLPTGALPRPNASFSSAGAPELPQNATDGQDNVPDALVVMKDRTSVGWLADFIVDRMVDQCGGQTDPAIQFYGCIENTTQLPGVWSAMGLNATLMRIHTLDTFTFTGANVSEDKNTFVTLLQQRDDAQNLTLTELFQTFGSQADRFCLNADGLLSCLNPYLSACFPDADTDNSVQPDKTSPTATQVVSNDQDPQANGAAGTATISTDASDMRQHDDSDDSDDDDDSTQSFFMIPFLQTQSQIFPALQQALSVVCADQGAPLKEFIDNVPCLLQSLNQGSDTCDTYCQIQPTDLQTVSSNSSLGMTSSNDQTNSGSLLDQSTCSSLRGCMECQLDMATETCGQDVANSVQQMVQIYFNALQCFPNTNTNTIRSPFNAAVL